MAVWEQPSPEEGADGQFRASQADPCATSIPGTASHEPIDDDSGDRATFLRERADPAHPDKQGLRIIACALASRLPRFRP